MDPSPARGGAAALSLGVVEHWRTRGFALIDGLLPLDLIEELQRKAYYGVAAVLSLGRGVSDVAFQVRDDVLEARGVVRAPVTGSIVDAVRPGML